MPVLSRIDWDLVFKQRGKLEYPEEKKTLGADYKTNNKLKPDMTLGPRIEPGHQQVWTKGHCFLSVFLLGNAKQHMLCPSVYLVLS